MARKRSGESKNTGAENRTYSFRLDRTNEQERQVREILDAWIEDALNHSKTLRDIVSGLVLKHAGITLWDNDSQALADRIDNLAATVENQGERLSSEMSDQTQTIMRILSQLRSNPGAFQEYVERADGEDDALDASFIGNLLDNLGR
jgi:hypothetical protein